MYARQQQRFQDLRVVWEWPWAAAKAGLLLHLFGTAESHALTRISQIQA